MKDFETEIAVYDELLPKLLTKHRDKFAVIKGTHFLGVFAQYDEGYRAGLDAFGVVPFLLRQITSKPRVIHMLGLRTNYDRAQL